MGERKDPKWLMDRVTYSTVSSARLESWTAQEAHRMDQASLVGPAIDTSGMWSSLALVLLLLLSLTEDDYKLIWYVNSRTVHCLDRPAMVSVEQTWIQTTADGEFLCQHPGVGGALHDNADARIELSGLH